MGLWKKKSPGKTHTNTIMLELIQI